MNTTGGSSTPFIGLAIYDSMTVEDDDKNVYGHLVESWETSPDYLSTTFKVRPGVTFHDGEALTAENIKFMFERIVHPDNSRSPAVAALGPNFESVEVIDEMTAKVNLSAPNHTMLRRITRVQFGVPSIKSAGGMVGLEGNEAAKKLARQPIGAGPFHLTEWVQNTAITMESFKDYNWSPAHINHQGAPYLDGLEWIDIPDTDARFSALVANDIDMINRPGAVNVAQIREDPELRSYEAVRQGATWSMYFNNRLSPTDDVRVRQAMNHATNQDEIVELIHFNVHQPAKGGLLSPTTMGYDPGLEGKYPFDLEKAAQLLEAAGWTMGSGGVREKDGEQLTMRYITTASDTAVLAQSQVLKAGINIEVVTLPAGTAYTDRQSAAQDHLIEGGFQNEDPDFIRRQWHTQYLDTGVSPITNFRGYNNPKADELLTKQQQTPDGPERDAIWREVQALMTDEAVAVPVYYWVTVFGTRSNVEGITIGPVNDYTRFNSTWLS